MLNVDSLNKGIVIDHIKAGKSMDIYNYLNLDQLECSVAIIKHVRSSKLGKKDIIKIEGILDINLEVLGFIDCNITVNIIENGRIIEKKKLTLPDKVVNIIKCKNPRCITSVENQVDHIFKLSNSKKGVYRCIYCEQEFQKN